MSEIDPSASERHQVTLAEVVAQALPIGDLKRFEITDLTADDEAEFFAILAKA